MHLLGQVRVFVFEILPPAFRSSQYLLGQVRVFVPRVYIFLDRFACLFLKFFLQVSVLRPTFRVDWQRWTAQFLYTS
jgi:hypothetical protein